jgi:Uma2 family endonuclease
MEDGRWRMEVRFPDPDSSLKRPDIAIFCVEPPDSDEALDLLPAAVIEILSLGYEEKDLGEDGAPFYLACGIPDVLVVDPRTGLIRHYQEGQPMAELQALVTVELRCGCHVTL